MSLIAHLIYASCSFLSYQTLHTLAVELTIGWPGVQEKAFANSGMFTTTPLIRYCAGE